jgi:gliding motility-associated-like protein
MLKDFIPLSLKKLKVGVFIFFNISFFLFANCQQWNNWTFGNKSGLNFSTSPPSVFLSALKPTKNLQGNKISMSCESISDKQGKLLFYTDGQYVYNKLHQIMENGDSILGFNTKSEGSIILPDFHNENQYILFTQNTPIFGQLGLYRSKIDVSLNSGLGKVVEKNIPIYIDSFDYLTAIKHGNNRDYWIISLHCPDSFYAFRYSPVGIDTIVKSHYTSPYPQYIHFLYFGNINASHDGKMLIESCDRYQLTESLWSPFFTYVTAFNFDIYTGRITFNQFIEKEIKNKSQDLINHYFNAVFSPNDSLIYLTGLFPKSVAKTIFQYKRFVPNITSTKCDLNIQNTGSFASIGLGPDGKIYYLCCFPIQLCVLNKPNIYGMGCDGKRWILEINDNPESNYINWYSFPFTFYQPMIVDFEYNPKCNNLPNFVNKSDTNIFKNFTWYFDGKDSLSVFDVQYEFLKLGIHTVRLAGTTTQGYTRYCVKTINFIRQPTADFGFEKSVGCQWLGFQYKDSSKTDTIHPVNKEIWQWSFGDGTTSKIKNPLHIYTKSGIFDVELIYGNGFCTDTIVKKQVVEILAAPKPGFTLNSYQNCTPFMLQIKDASIGAVSKYLYTFGDGRSDSIASPTVFYNVPAYYFIHQTLTGPTGCVTKDSSYLYLRKGFNGVEQINSYTVNVLPVNLNEVSWENDAVATLYQVFRSSGNTNFEKYKTISSSVWIDSNVSTGKSVYTYKIQGLDSCGKPTLESRVIKNILLTGESFENEYSVVHWTPFEQWQNGVEKYSVEVKDSNNEYTPVEFINGLSYQDNIFTTLLNKVEKCYRIRAIEKDGNNKESISNIICLPYHPLIWIPNSFSPNGDKLNDDFIISTVGIREIKVTIFNRWGEKVFESNDLNKYWDGKFNGQLVVTGLYYYSICAKSQSLKEFNYTGCIYVLK